MVGGAIATAMGGWNAGLRALVIFMAIDYATGLMGLPITKIIKNGIEILIDKSEGEMDEEYSSIVKER